MLFVNQIDKKYYFSKLNILAIMQEGKFCGVTITMLVYHMGLSKSYHLIGFSKPKQTDNSL